MADNFKRKGGIKDTQGGDFGNYKEYNGGGSPKGGGWGGQSGRVGWKKRVANGEVKSGEHREGQPRDKFGHFTYNSVNGKETKYESRGKTVNPLLTGGDGTIKIEDVEKEFAAKSGNIYNKYKDKWYQRGSEKITKEGRKLKTVISSDAIWDIARLSFDVTKGEFTGEGKVWDTTKTGARSKEEKAARKQAHADQEETYVSDTATGGIKQHTPKTQTQYQKPQTGRTFSVPFRKLAANRAAQQAAQQASAPAPQAQAQAQPAPAPAQAPVAPTKPAAPALKHTQAQIDGLKKFLLSKTSDPNKIKQINSMSNAWFDNNYDRFVKKKI